MNGRDNKDVKIANLERDVYLKNVLINRLESEVKTLQRDIDRERAKNEDQFRTIRSLQGRVQQMADTELDLRVQNSTLKQLVDEGINETRQKVLGQLQVAQQAIQRRYEQHAPTEEKSSEGFRVQMLRPDALSSSESDSTGTVSPETPPSEETLVSSPS